MALTVEVKNIGLRGVTVADTKISFIDGNQGILIYRGYRIEELAERSTFPETAFLLLNGYLPSPDELMTFEQILADNSEVPDFIYDCLKKLPHDSNPMDTLQACVPLLATADPDIKEDNRPANLKMAMRLIARLPVVISLHLRSAFTAVIPSRQIRNRRCFIHPSWLPCLWGMCWDGVRIPCARWSGRSWRTCWSLLSPCTLSCAACACDARHV